MNEDKAALFITGTTLIGVGAGFSTTLIGLGTGVLIISIIWFLMDI